MDKLSPVNKSANELFSKTLAKSSTLPLKVPYASIREPVSAEEKRIGKTKTKNKNSEHDVKNERNKYPPVYLFQTNVKKYETSVDTKTPREPAMYNISREKSSNQYFFLIAKKNI
ncbi:hypothetical protein ACFSJU_05685 [Paradesertivirga mongoliensis]|uniref:Uncharacterized protein n=1 Tax=Paradesertivirga mongoliensis TaxID=2100740 RepID=A0ABW4ZIM0_9SPHI|nr:hypothetical protein [Pedobacter mongoliensis]